MTRVVVAEYSTLLALGRSLVGADGDDLVQDTLLRALREQRPVLHPMGWLRRVMRNEAHSQHRSAARRGARERASGPAIEPVDTEALLVRSQVLDALQDEWSALDEPYAEALRLRFDEGLTARAIGERQGCPTNTASWRVREGICRLRRRLDARFGGRRHWLGALAAVTGIPGGTDPTADSIDDMKPSVTLPLVLSSAAALGLAATAWAVSDDDTRTGGRASAVAAVPVDSVSSTASQSVAASPDRTEPADRSFSSSLPGDPDFETSRDYGVQVQISTRQGAQGVSACDDEVRELSSITRDIYPGCCEHAGYDPDAKFEIEFEFELQDGRSVRTKNSMPELGEGATELGQCLIEGLFPEQEREYTPGFDGALSFRVRPLAETEYATASKVERVLAEEPREFDLRGAPSRGPDDAAITVLECVDLECPFTREVAPTLDRVLDEYGTRIRFVQLQNPLVFHSGARDKARALVAAQAQGGYWDALDYLYTHPQPFQPEDFTAMAQALEFDEQAFENARTSASSEDEVARQQALCAPQGRAGTPTFFFDGQRMAGARDFEVFAGVLDAKLESAEPPR